MAGELSQPDPLRPRTDFARDSGFHFGLGSGLGTLAAVIWIFIAQLEYPAIVACGGVFGLMIQTLALGATEVAREWKSNSKLEERWPTLSVVLGIASAVITFASATLAAERGASDAVSFLATMVPLLGCPVLASFVLSRDGSARRE